MTRSFQDTVTGAAGRLSKAGVISPMLDAQLLLAHVFDVGRTWILARMKDAVPDDKFSVFEQLVKRRLAREPVAYITGVKEFYSLEFKVDPRVLIPRPETEGIVDAALAMYGEDSSKAALDMGTGCGAIAVALLKRRPLWHVTAIDSSAAALEVARENARFHGVDERVTLLNSDLFARLPKTKFDLIVSNPPYVCSGAEGVDLEVARFEPKEALYSGDDGLIIIRRIVEEGAGYLQDEGRMIIEIGDGQSAAVREIFEKNGAYNVESTLPDLQGMERVIVAVKIKRDG